ncbi:deoxycytidylate deaminase [Candidatus Peregrinibacteria bacterium]|nr:deoxycytidylate deaminase [Candidatus Peregrinibacteria bacterium]
MAHAKIKKLTQTLQNDKKFLKQTLKLAEKSLCLRKRVAVMIVKNGKILMAKTNDPLPAYDCKKLGCIRDQMNIPHGHRREICYGICAEMYAIASLAASGKNAKGATLYVTIHPCRICEGLIASAGIKRVVYASDYPSVMPHIDTLRDHGIEALRIVLPIPKEQKTRHLILK